MKTDLEILLESWKKYKNKNGRKAQKLKLRIQSQIAWVRLFKEMKKT